MYNIDENKMETCHVLCRTNLKGKKKEKEREREKKKRGIVPERKRKYIMQIVRKENIIGHSNGNYVCF